MPLPTTEPEISADIMEQLGRYMKPVTPKLDRMSALAEHFRSLKQTEADEIARLERRDQERQDEVWQARADDGDEVEA